MKAIKTLLAVSVLAAAGAANAATVSNFTYNFSGVITGLGALAGILTGSATGSGTGVLDDSGTLTLTDVFSSTTNIGGTQNLTATKVFTGSYAGGVFTATAGTQTLLSCSGPNCQPTPVTNTYGSVSGSLSLTSGTLLTGIDVAGGAAHEADTYHFTGTPVTPTVPVPAAAWLFGSGLLGLAGTARRRK